MKNYKVEKQLDVKEVSAEDYLTSDLYDFYLDIITHSDSLDKLTASEMQHVLGSMENIEKKLCNKFGKDASFRIYFDEEHQMEYVKWQKK